MAESKPTVDPKDARIQEQAETIKASEQVVSDLEAEKRKLRAELAARDAELARLAAERDSFKRASEDATKAFLDESEKHEQTAREAAKLIQDTKPNLSRTLNRQRVKFLESCGIVIDGVAKNVGPGDVLSVEQEHVARLTHETHYEFAD